jgi:hypothetical protein
VTYPYQYPEGLTGVTYTFTDVKHSPYFSRDLTLKDNDKNSSTIGDYKNKTVKVTIEGRTFYHDGCWNTICLPFDLSEEQLAAENCPLHGATIKELSDASFANGILTLTFSKDLTATEAGKAYIVRWEQGDNVTDPVFKNVAVRNESNPKFIIKDKDGKWPEDESDIFFSIVFWGSYNPTVITDDLVATKQLLYLGADNKLYYPATQMTIGAFRGFFHLYGITVGDLAQGANSIVLDFGDETTGVALIDNGKRIMDNDAWYTLDGRRLNGKPSRAGVYINNGRKVVVK